MPIVARVPDEAGPEQYGGYASWERWPGVNCFGGRGGLVMPEFDPAPAITNLAECMDLCAATPECDGILTQDDPSVKGCWLRSEVDIQDCYPQAPWIMYTPKQGGVSLYYLSGDNNVGLARIILVIVTVVLVLAIIALAVLLIKKKKLLCFKEKPPQTVEEVMLRKEFEEMDADGDGIITAEEFAKFRQEQRSCGRDCNGGWCIDGGDKEEKPKIVVVE